MWGKFDALFGIIYDHEEINIIQSSEKQIAVSKRNPKYKKIIKGIIFLLYIEPVAVWK